ncbi:hypothetical protein HWB05_gp165 [Streptomyces phage BRock]|uniref:Uncharacterized protein n=1 Tax=Streptomyces phage BRock TaxID=1913591 RepID=A0A1J0GW75_9CAUD|nr:hypothetical protein HWB05_gp165 [Streptomyces phage BRock]APC46428.1 hypothetical protein [Streptomyces phage BRock]
MAAITCPTTCWGCKFDMHDENPHPWWDAEDVWWAEKNKEPLPTGYCGCYCSRNKVNELKEEANREDS